MSGTPELMRAVGEALFGPRWITDLGDHLGVNRRTIARWLAGEFEPQPGVWSDLREVLRERSTVQRQLIGAIDQELARRELNEPPMSREQPRI
jgi:hypothetical protein